MNELILKACQALTQADAVLIGASNGLSIAEGYHLFACNDMYQRQFGDFLQQYGIRNVIEGCFFPDPQIRREFLQRLIHHWVETYQPSQVMKDLLALIQHKDYFILTTNADTHLELSGMDPNRIFEMEGTFVQALQGTPIADKSRQVQSFLSRYHGKRLVILELGIGRHNRLIKQPLMQLAASEPNATYITLNLAQELYVPPVLATRSIALEGDIATTLREMNHMQSIQTK